MGDYRLGARVEDDLFEIWSYLAAESSPHLADRVEREIFAVFRAIADAPGIGHVRRDLTSRDLYFFAVYEYLVVYRKSRPIEIVGVFHGRRDAGDFVERR